MATVQSTQTIDNVPLQTDGTGQKVMTRHINQEDFSSVSWLGKGSRRLRLQNLRECHQDVASHSDPSRRAINTHGQEYALKSAYR